MKACSVLLAAVAILKLSILVGDAGMPCIIATTYHPTSSWVSVSSFIKVCGLWYRASATTQCFPGTYSATGLYLKSLISKRWHLRGHWIGFGCWQSVLMACRRSQAWTDPSSLSNFSQAHTLSRHTHCSPSCAVSLLLFVTSGRAKSVWCARHIVEHSPLPGFWLT